MWFGSVSLDQVRLKGQAHEIFYFCFYYQKTTPGPSVSHPKVAWNLTLNLQRYSNLDPVLLCGPQHRMRIGAVFAFTIFRLTIPLEAFK